MQWNLTRDKRGSHPHPLDQQKRPPGGDLLCWWRRRDYSAHPCASPSGPYSLRSHVQIGCPANLGKPATRLRSPSLHANNKKPPQGRFFDIWWRRRESNPRPQVIRLRLYMLIRSIDLTWAYPTGREKQKRAWMSFNGSTPGVLHRGPVWVDPRTPARTGTLRAEGTTAGF